jgi:mannose-6-phosphate isomerase
MLLMADMKLYPLLFNQVLLEKVWGGHSIHQWKYGEKTPEAIGESWEIHTMNIISKGAFAGQTLQEVIDRYPLEMTGRSEAIEFPLLVKILDAQEWLSVQVHPDDALALQLEGEPRGKTECWFILSAEHDAKIQYDLKKGISIQEYADSIEQEKPTEQLQFMNVKSGDVIFVPAGTVHAIGPGILLYELQQTSDTTYRLYDWDRPGLDGKPRELHIEKGLKCSRPGAGTFPYHQFPIITDGHGNSMQALVNEQYFKLDTIILGSQAFDCSMNHRAKLITNIGEHDVHILHDESMEVLPKAHSAFLPAGMGNVKLYSPDANAKVLIASEHAS